ncbi:hypothetical protein CEE45_05045 [Candidatus Heimdallarchaeota archaeon B3_Heim]|nr:MAG: hypothetical protein CEE45_05045 [Candidatus Heimdallarchaeota archaeon B3_Heim]
MIDKVYIEAAIESLDLVLQIASHLHSTQKIHNMNDFLAQIQTKAESKISSSLGQRLGISIPVDQEGKPPKYWEGVRDMAKLSVKKWSELNNIPKYLVFLSGTKSNLAAKVGIQVAVNPLEDFVGDAPVQAAQPVAEPVNPLEDMLSTPEHTSAVIPTPTPEPVSPSIPEPIIPEITQPQPVFSEPVPAPKPIQPTPTPTAIPAVEPSDKLSALDEALQASGLETSPPADPSPSLSDMLLTKDEIGEKTNEEDDMLSLSLREALKILRDEDED